MPLRRTLSAVAAGLTLATSLAVPAAAAPDPQRPTVEAVYTTFPGARIGERVGPAELKSPAALSAGDAAALDAATQTAVCDGDGTSGKRIEVLYMREATMPDRYTQFLPMFRAWLADTDDVYNDAAATSSRSRHLRFVTTAVGGGCAIVVRNLTVAAGALNTFDTSIAAAQAAGYNSVNRHYLMLTEATSICGVGQISGDDLTTGSGNLNNGLAYARVDAIPGCFGENAIAHELGHTFGAVQLSAPHTDGGWHCLDQWDLMCYGGTPSWTCLQWNDFRIPDCNRDDYFNANPTVGSYLATHWNTANSAYMIAGGTADSDPHPKVGSTYVITNSATGGALEPIGGVTTPLTELSQRTRVDTPSQKWLMGYTTGLQLINVGSRQCADSSYSGTTPGTTMLQYFCNGQDGMRLAYLPVGANTYAIIDWLSGLALTAGSAYPSPITQETYTGAANQLWVFNKVTDASPANGTAYTIQGIDNRDAMDVVGGSSASGALITHNALSGVNSQRWTAQASGSFWKFVNVNSGRCLDLASASTAVGVQLRQVTCGSATTQQWTLRKVADGTFFLVNRFSGKVANMTTAGGSILDQQTITGDNRNLVWYLNPA